MNRRLFLYLSALVAGSLSRIHRVVAQGLPKAAAVPGGVAVLPLGPSGQAPVVHLAGNRVMVVGDAQRWQAII